MILALAVVLITLLTLAWDLRYGDVSCETITPSPRS